MAIDDDGIEWTGTTPYPIAKQRLTEKGTGERANCYDWLLHLTEKTWLKPIDIYQLNTAFIYVLVAMYKFFTTHFYRNYNSATKAN